MKGTAQQKEGTCLQKVSMNPKGIHFIFKTENKNRDVKLSSTKSSPATLLQAPFNNIDHEQKKKTTELVPQLKLAGLIHLHV